MQKFSLKMARGSLSMLLRMLLQILLRLLLSVLCLTTALAYGNENFIQTQAKPNSGFVHSNYHSSSQSSSSSSSNKVQRQVSPKKGLSQENYQLILARLKSGQPQELLVAFTLEQDLGQAVSGQSHLPSQRQNYTTIGRHRLQAQGNSVSSQSLWQVRRAQKQHRARLTANALIQFRHGLSLLSLRSLQEFKYLPWVKLQVASEAQFKELLALEGVKAVTLQRHFKAMLNQSLPLVGRDLAELYGVNGAGVSQAIVDSGLDYQNSFFACNAPGEANCQVRAVYEAAADDGQLDSVGHGTQVAAIAATMAPASGIVAIDVFDNDNASTSDLVAAVDWIIENQETYNIVVANFSLGSSQTYTSYCDDNNPWGLELDPLYHAFVELKSLGILAVAASGNGGADNGISLPACYSSALSVGATYDQNLSLSYGHCSDINAMVDDVACFSNTANFMDMLAPGTLIDAAGRRSGGTSMAAPHVSGAAALVKSRFPQLDVDGLEAKLKSSSVWLLDPKASNQPPQGFPRLELASALAPLNDNWSSAQALELGSSVGGDFAFASKEVSELGAFDASLWFRFTPAVSGDYLVQVESEGAMELGLYQATISATTPATTPATSANPNDISDLVRVFASQNVQATTTYLTAGEAYWLQLVASSGAQGFEISVNPSSPWSDEDIPFLPPWALVAMLGAFSYMLSISRRAAIKSQ